jgi:hypothetical protein
LPGGSLVAGAGRHPISVQFDHVDRAWNGSSVHAAPRASPGQYLQETPRMFRSLPFVLLAGLLVAASADAGKVKTWYHHAAADYDKAKFDRAVVSNQGTLRLARELRPLADLDAAHVWDIVEDAAGNLIVATGDDGKLFRVGADGKAKLLTQSKESQVLCLVRTPDGGIYAGTGPSGKVLKIDGDGKSAVVADGLGKYVWSLVWDQGAKSLVAGTGPKGKIYRVGLDGKTDVFYATKQDHVMSLALDGPTLYAGTDKGGLVYRIDPAGKAFVLYHASQNEVRTIAVHDQIVYAGTSSPATKRLPATPTKPAPSSPGGSSGGGSSSGASTGPDDKTKSALEPSSGTTFAGPEPKGSPASPPSSAGIGENSLYRIASDGTVRELFRDKTLVLSLLRVGGRLYVGTGMQGQLFEIDEATKERVELARLDHGEIHCLLRRKDGSIVLGTGDPGKIYVLEDRHVKKGDVVSDVLDAKLVSTWGAVSWKAETPAGTSVAVSVRAGNVATPDDTWSVWAPCPADAEVRAKTPNARYLQYRIEMKTDDPKITPEVRQIAIRYRTNNQAPEITSLDVPDLDAVNLDQPKKFRIRWSATDPNEDELTFDLYVKKSGWKDWVLLEENLDRKDFEWDTTKTPSGMYQVKVVASDRHDNPAEEAMTAEKISAEVPISNLPPVVTVKQAGFNGGAGGMSIKIHATAVDPYLRLTEASYSIDGKRWENIFPAGGIFDSKKEEFSFSTERLKPGSTHVVMVRVRDAGGNVGSGDLVFTVPDPVRALTK